MADGNQEAPTAAATATDIRSVEYHPVVASRLDVFQRLCQAIPNNENFGLPQFIYRPDLISENFPRLPHKEQMEVLHSAAIPISYDDGFPVMPDGKLFWDRLDFEEDSAFARFQDFLALSKSHGYRSVPLLIDKLHPSQAQCIASGLTSGWFSDEFRTKRLAAFREWYVYNSWGLRAKAFDMVHAAAYSKLRERRAMETENYHYIKLEKIMESVLARFDRMSEDDWNSLDPLKAVAALKEVAHLQRVAVGLPATAPLPEKSQDNNAGTSLEVRLRTIAKKHAAGDDSGNSNSELTDRLLESPEALAIAQELIVRVSKTEEAGEVADVGVDGG